MKDYTLALVALVILSAIGITGCSAGKPETENKPDYAIYCGNDTLTIMDSSVTVAKIPYSDSSGLWQIILNDNR